MLQIKTSNAGGVTVLDLNGCLVTGFGLELLRPCIQKLITEKRLNVVLNANEVSVINSSGVGELVASFSSLKRNGGSMKIASPSKFVREVLQITRLPAIIEVFDTVEAAVKAFEK